MVCQLGHKSKGQNSHHDLVLVVACQFGFILSERRHQRIDLGLREPAASQISKSLGDCIAGVEDKQHPFAIGPPFHPHDRHGVPWSLEVDWRHLRETRSAILNSVFEIREKVCFDIVQKLRVCWRCFGIRRCSEGECCHRLAEVEEVCCCFVSADPFACVADASCLGATESACTGVPCCFDGVLNFEHVW